MAQSNQGNQGKQANQPSQAHESPQDENQIMAERRAKLTELRRSGIAFPND